VLMTPKQLPIPPAPDRTTALTFNIHGQGAGILHTQQYGDLHWWPAALSWLDNPADRLASYNLAKQNGDTHVIIELPDGKPLYDECCNDYSPDRGFTARDWTNGGGPFDARLADLVVEVRRAGLIPVIFPDEATQQISLSLTLRALDALTHSRYGDIHQQVGFYMTGWDGVFYGWEPSDPLIPNWANTIRAQYPDVRLGIEFNSGHIPIGEGGSDYAPGGRLQNFDIILAEINPGLNDDTFWQIVARMVPHYVRPADQPAHDDPNPPFYLGSPNPRGMFFFSCFEWNMYGDVRGQLTVQQLEADRQKLKAAGCYIVG
jgi:hypothetical protein